MYNQSLKHKFIVVSYGYEYYDYVYHQFENSSYAKYSHNITFPYVLERLYYRHVFNKRINLPFKNLWIKLYLYYISKYVKSIAKSEDKICFLFLSGGKNNKLLEYGLAEELRNKYKDSKIVYFLNDLVSKTRQPIDLIKAKADLVITFDPGDAKKYGLLNHVIPYSDQKFEKNIEVYDVTFVGAAKDRLTELLTIHKYLISKGIKSYFHIINVPIEEQETIEGVVYSGFISYMDNLKILSQSRCIIEIVQKEGTGNTIRVGEAIIMGKKILTNNPHIVTNGIYEKSNMSIFSNCEDIDIDFLKDKEEIVYSKKMMMNPTNLLFFIEKNLYDK